MSESPYDLGAHVSFDQFLRTREMVERLNGDRQAAHAAMEAQRRSIAPRAWLDLQRAMREIAVGKRYKGELFIWREATGHPACIVLKNVAACFVDRHWDEPTFAVMLAGIPGVHPLWGLRSPDPEFIDVRYLGPDRWLVGAALEEMTMTGQDSAAEQLCKALVTYFDDHQRSQGRLVS